MTAAQSSSTSPTDDLAPDNDPDRNPARLDIGGRSAHHNPNRGAIMHCPYCGGEDLWPDTETDYAWQCRECCRVFTVKLHGHIPREVAF